MWISSKDVFDSLPPSRKLALWAYAKRVFGKHNSFHFTAKGASEDLYFDIAVLSGATAPQGLTLCVSSQNDLFLVTKMRGDENDEEIQELIAKTRKTLLKVIRHKLKQLYIEEQKTYPGQVLRDVHLEILKRNLTLL